MIKKILALAATALLSANASAGYVQYNFTGPVQGFIIQHEEDGSIADFRLDIQMRGLGIHGGLDAAASINNGPREFNATKNRFKLDGPTEFTYAWDDDSVQDARVDLFFRQGPGDVFGFTLNYWVNRWFAYDGWLEGKGRILGHIVKAEVDPNVALGLDYLGGYTDNFGRDVPVFAPNNSVPEPASLALFGVGAFGALAFARRRKSAK